MAWSWSDYDINRSNVWENIEDFSRDELEVIWAEWVASFNTNKQHPYRGYVQLSIRKYHTALARAKHKMTDELVEFVQNKTGRLGTCTNGGHMAWCCPFGCAAHMVSFDRNEELCSASDAELDSIIASLTKGK